MGIVWFKDISKKDQGLVGQKAAFLAEMYNSEYPVPPGFVIPNSIFLKFLESTALSGLITQLISKSNLEDKNTLINVSSRIQELITESRMPEDSLNPILKAYEDMHVNISSFKSASPQVLNILNASRDSVYVSVRSSPDTSIEGVSFLNISGTENLIRSIKKCWAYLFTPDILYKTKGNIRSSIIIQKMVDANKSGVIETSPNEININVCLGLNESKLITFDKYVVSRDNFKIISKQINKQDFCIVKDINLGKSVRRTLLDYEASIQKLDDLDVIKLAKLSSLIIDLFHSHVVVDFAIEGGKLYFLQAIPIAEETKESKIVQRMISQDVETVTSIRIYANTVPAEIENSDGIGLLTCNKEDLPEIALKLSNKSAWFLSNNIENEMPYIKQCHDSGFNNIGIILPNAESVEHVRKYKDIIRANGLEPLEEIELGIIIENPLAVQNLDSISRDYVDFISIDLDNLAKAIIPDENITSRINPTVLRLIKHVVEVCKEYDIEICFQGESVNNPDIADFLVRLGADTLIVSPSMVKDLRKTVEKAERKMLLEAARKTSNL